MVVSLGDVLRWEIKSWIGSLGSGAGDEKLGIGKVEGKDREQRAMSVGQGRQCE